MGIAISFRKTPKDIIKWEIEVKTIGWILVFRPISIILWRLSPLLICYFGWRNPYTRKIKFGAGIAKNNKGAKMDIGTHDEVPKEPKKKQSQWLFLPKKLKDHKHEIEPFVECHLTFDGNAGPCNSCVAQELCLRLLNREQEEE